jgi:mRNA interferase RelE/StbE
LRIYSLAFLPSALREWHKLGANIRTQFGKKLEQRLSDPHVASARLRNMPTCYKIKLRAAGYRLVYQVEDDKLIVIVVAVGRRDRNLVYKLAAGRVE